MRPYSLVRPAAWFWLAALTASLVAGTERPTQAGPTDIVINEIMYRPRREESRQEFDRVNHGTYYQHGDDELGQYVELFNRSTNSVKLDGWAFTHGISYTFPDGATLAAGEYVVVAASPATMRARFGITNVVGPFAGGLSHRGERLTLCDSSGHVMNTLKYSDTHPWPEAPDEFGCSLECLNPWLDNSTPANWRACQARRDTSNPSGAWSYRQRNGRGISQHLASRLPGDLGASPPSWTDAGVGGTPGRANSVLTTNLPPLVEVLAHWPEQPRSTNQVTITTRIRAACPLTSVRLEMSRNLDAGSTFLDMYDDGKHGDRSANDGVYGVILPPQPSQTLVHYRVHATDSHGSTTTFPYPDDPSPTQAYFHYDDDINTHLTLFHLFLPTNNWAWLNANPRSNTYVDCSLVVNHVAYPHIGVRYYGRESRSFPEHPWKFRFHKSQLYDGNRTYDTKFSIPLEQELAFETFDRAGIANLKHELIRMHLNGPFWGVYVGFESPTGSWLGKHGYDPAGELYKARSVETPDQAKNSDLFHDQIVTDLDYWGAYDKRVRPLEKPDSIRALVNAVNDLPDEQLLPWLDAHVDLDQWFKRWALLICMNIDDFPGHNHYHFLAGEAGGKWCWLGYDFDSGFTYGRVGPLRAFYGDGNNGDNPDWQRNKLCARVSANATLRRIYLLTLRRMLNEVDRVDVMSSRLDELFALMKPDRQLNAVWGTLRNSTIEAKRVLASQKQSLSSSLATANLPGVDKTPQVFPAGGRITAGTAVTLSIPQGWKVYFTLDGSDPRLSLTRCVYSVPLVLKSSGMLKAAAIPANESLATGDWSDLATKGFVIVPHP